MPAAMRRAVAHHTDRGRRATNQDAVLATCLSDGRELIAVADGMGGHAAGEVASRRALEVVVSELEAGADLRHAVQAANAAVFEEAGRNPDWRGMGTTLVALLLTGERYQIANVGDSRAYRVIGEEIQQVTEDHSFVAEVVRNGQMSEEEAARSPWRHALTRAIGTESELEVEIFGPFSTAEPHRVLLCSDGLYRGVPDELLLERICAATDLAATVEALAAHALEAGVDDNITLALVEFGDSGEPPPEAASREPSASRMAPVSDEQDADPARRRRTRRTRYRRAGGGRRWARYELAFILVLLALVVGYVILLVVL